MKYLHTIKYALIINKQKWKCHVMFEDRNITKLKLHLV